MQAVAIVQRAMRGAEPTARMAELGFGSLSLVSRFPVSMSGSEPAPGEVHALIPAHIMPGESILAFL